jgi:antitoxin CptB
MTADTSPPPPREHREKRLRLRSWRRGIRECDLLLGAYADARAAAMTDADLALFEALLDENDQEVYVWLSRATGVPDAYAGLVARVRSFHGL